MSVVFVQPRVGPRWWWSPWRRRAWRRAQRIARNERIARDLGLIPPKQPAPYEVAASSVQAFAESMVEPLRRAGAIPVPEQPARGRGAVLDHAEVMRLTAAAGDPVLVRNGMGEVVQVIDANPRPRRPDPTRPTT